MAVVKPPPHDRLLSAIKTAVQRLMLNPLVTLDYDIESVSCANYWSGRWASNTRLIATADAEEFVMRKHQGIALLAQLRVPLANERTPKLRLTRLPNPPTCDDEDLAMLMPRLVAEAAKYGWHVDGTNACAT